MPRRQLQKPTSADEGRSSYKRKKMYRRITLRDNNGEAFLDRVGFACHWFGIYLHWNMKPDPGMDLHDHPWPFVSLILRGGYAEQYAPARDASAWALEAEASDAARTAEHRTGWPSALRGLHHGWWLPGSVHFVGLGTAHRIVSTKANTATLVIRGRDQRQWGFFCPTGWVPWTDYDYENRRPGSFVDNSLEARPDV